MGSYFVTELFPNKDRKLTVKHARSASQHLLPETMAQPLAPHFSSDMDGIKWFLWEEMSAQNTLLPAELPV